MGGEFTYQPKWDPICFDPQPHPIALDFTAENFGMWVVSLVAETRMSLFLKISNRSLLSNLPPMQSMD